MASLKGFSKVKNKINMLKRGAPKVYKAAITDLALRVRKESQQLVPIDTGVLRGSVQNGLIGTPDADGAEAYVAYTAEYAVIVHEDLKARHRPPTTAKYLTLAVDKVGPLAPKIYAYYLRKFTK